MAQSETNYTWEMLTSEPSKVGSLVWVMLALGATFFLGMWAIPIFAVIYLGLVGVAVMFLPDIMVFRAWVDKVKRAEQREAVRTRLRAMIDGQGSRIHEGHHHQGGWVGNPVRTQFQSHGADYQRMMNRLQSLKELAGDPRNPINDADIERLEDATIDYLRMFHAHLSLQQRLANSDGEGRVQTQLSSVETQLQAQGLANAERRRLEKSRTELLKLQDQRKRVPGQLAAAEAQLTTMSETFEELFHRITANPQGTSASAYLDEAASRLAAEEEISMAVEEEMGELSDLTKYRAARAASNRVPQ